MSLGVKGSQTTYYLLVLRNRNGGSPLTCTAVYKNDEIQNSEMYLDCRGRLQLMTIFMFRCNSEIPVSLG